MMHFGTQFSAPIGVGSFRPEVRYYFAGDRNDGTVLIIWFVEAEERERRVLRMTLPRERFEDLLLCDPPQLVPNQIQYVYPPWLESVDGVAFEWTESRRFKAKKETLLTKVQKRFDVIADALDRTEEILNAPDPLTSLSSLASQRPTKVNPFRYQVHFFAYILHNKNMWALQGSTHRIGRWDRKSALHAKRKFGRRSFNPETAFRSTITDEVKANILASYRKRAALGVCMTTIHQDALMQDFKCKTYTSESGATAYYHPRNEPFPSYSQFRRVVVHEFGIGRVREIRNGRTKEHENAVIDRGTYKAQYANLLESLEVDVQRVRERPSALTHDGVGEVLAMARGVCPTVSGCVGVGFSIGAETEEAYRSMEFSMAVPKSYVEKMYGIEPGRLAAWKMMGVSMNRRADRGAGGQPRATGAGEFCRPIESIVPSGAKQSKAIVESAQARTPTNSEAPAIVQSDLNTVELMKREVLRVASENDTSDISDRLSDEMIADFLREGRVATPNHLWAYLEARGRSSASQMSLHEAVRTFWTPHKFKVDRKGIWYRHRSFDSSELVENGLLERLVRSGINEVSGYAFSAVFRIIWIECGGSLYELTAQHLTRENPDDLFTTITRLHSASDDLKKLRSITREHRQAAAAQVRQSFFEDTNVRWDQGKRKPARVSRKSKERVAENQAVRGYARRKKS